MNEAIELSADERALIVFALGYYIGSAMREHRSLDSEAWETILRKFGVIYAD